MYSYFGNTHFLIGKIKSFFWEHNELKWGTIMFASPRSIVMEKMKYIYCCSVARGSKYYSFQYLNMRPLVACGLEAKQLGPQFYWSFPFHATFSLLRGHNNFVSMKAQRKTK